ncbi:MAG: NAD(P)/FAD-dependent oxidoreductase [Hyphomicrobiaceae bacterium]
MLVVGAGPAGMAAATATASAGLRTVLVDEAHSPGGQVWRAVTTTPVSERFILGADYWCGTDAAEALAASNVTYLPNATVWGLDETGTVSLTAAGTARRIAAARVIIATGAQERPFPVPGWTLPGVMTVGAAQGLLKSSALYPSGKLVIAGTGPLIWLYAAQLLRAGGRIERILDTTEPAARWRALRHLPAFLTSSYVAKGLALMAKVRRQVPVVRAVEHLAIEGDEHVTTVRYRSREGESQVAADTVLLHQGVVPQVNLAMAAGVHHHWDEQQLCFVPVLDATGRSNLERIFVAGDSAGIAGWEAAEDRGRIAAAAVIEALDPKAARSPSIEGLQRRLARKTRARRFLDEFFRPPDQFRIPKGATTVCRCEDVTASEVESAVALGALGPAQLKSYTRCGMGPCQGRMCGLTVTEIMAACREVPPSQIGYFRLRPPVKPVTVQELASMPTDDDDANAVTARRR